MHYLYTAFYFANSQGLPIMRPMWMEFPTDTNVFTMGSQFMFGEHMLVKPKLGTPIPFSTVMNGIYNIDVYLPPSADWYFKDTKQFIQGSSSTIQVLVGDD